MDPSAKVVTTPALPSAEEICRPIKLTPGARRLLGRASEPAAFLNLLTKQKLYADGARFLAHWLPERDAVWWASLCTWHTGRTRLTPAEHAALGAAVHWVHDPSEANRKKAAAAADGIGPRNPAASAARAASLSTHGAAPIPSSARPAARSAAVSVLFAVLHRPPAERALLSRQFLVLGRDLTRGNLRWQ